MRQVASTVTERLRTNRITNSGFSYDANGNLTAMPGLSMGYDYDNRLSWVTGLTGSYGYDPENRRVLKITGEWYGPPTEVYFYGVEGRKLGTYSVSWDRVLPLVNISTVHENLHFAGRLIKSNNNWVVTDRLGSVVKSEYETLRYFPWGEERTTTTQNRDKFATYFRDSTGLDNANQRYYSSQHGRFLTPDPYISNDALRNPQSWNRYPYVENDPVNFLDPAGLDRIGIEQFMGCIDAPWIGPWGWKCDPTRSADGGTPRGGGGGLIEQSRGGSGVSGRDPCDDYISDSGIRAGIEKVADIIETAAAASAVSVELIAVTWLGESSFRTNPPPNVNGGPEAILAGNVDIGPMQVNYKWHNEAVGAANLGAVFGSFNPGTGSVPARFDGSVQANVNYGATILGNLQRDFKGASAAEIAGRYVIGYSQPSSLSPGNRANYDNRVAGYNRNAEGFRKWFEDCR